MAIDMEQFQEIFIEESFESLDIMESGLLAMDTSNPDQEIINNIFRAAHSIKGGAGTFNFPEVSEFTHIQESLLDLVRDGKRGLSKELIDTLLECVDCVRNMLETSRNKNPIDMERVESLSLRLEKFMSANTLDPQAEVSVEEAAESVTQSEEDDGEQSSSASDKCCWNISFKPYNSIFKSSNDPYRFIRELNSLGEAKVSSDTTAVPALDEIDPELSYLVWHIELESNCVEADILEIFDWIEDECDLEITCVNAGAKDDVASQAIVESSEYERDPAPILDVQGESEDSIDATMSQSELVTRSLDEIGISTTESSSIRVDINKIESLINLVGELVITQSALSQYSTELDDNSRLKSGLQQLSANIQELQEQSMRIRMLPIDFVFQRLPRLIRDLSSTLNKQVQFELIGRHTEVDKTVLEKITDPLVHLVRNALDHGIEPPEERAKNGKPAQALLKISAEHESGNIVIRIVDDGRGLDLDKILRKAIEKGLAEESDNLSSMQIQNLIFSPGFSTADAISDVSGRGVGLDVVKQNIKSLGGDVSVVSSTGAGSEFKITLPLTMAILDGQLVRVGNDIFVIPMINIEKSVRIDDSNVSELPGGQRLYRFEEEYIPTLDLIDFYAMRESGEGSGSSGDILVVITADRTAGVVVDEVLGQQQVVIRSLETNFHRVETVAGATILGDGTVALILDSSEVISVAHTSAEQNQPQRVASH